MKCKDFEQEIYLYSELTASEKEPVDEHIRQCAACQKLFATMRRYQSVVNELAENKPQPVNHARLTSNIMQAIQSKPKEESTLFSLLQRSFVKYSFVAASLMLVILFVTEQQAFVESEKPIVVGAVTLKTTSIANVLDQKNKPNTSFYMCIKSENCNNALVENLKQRRL